MKYDKTADYATKTMKELYAIRTQFEKAVEKRPVGTFNEHLDWVKMTIAERIGKN